MFFYLVIYLIFIVFLDRQDRGGKQKTDTDIFGAKKKTHPTREKKNISFSQFISIEREKREKKENK